MKKFLLLFAIVLLTVPSQVSAQKGSTVGSKTERVITLSPDETVDRDYFAVGDVVEISGTVNGDVYAAGGQISVDGTVNGDLLVAGGTISISGDITQDARVAGGQITVSGKIGRNLTVAGGNVDLTDSAEVAGSLAAGAGNLSLRGPIKGNAMVGTGNLTLSNAVGGDLEAGVETMRLTSKAEVGGDLIYWSDEDALIDESAKVSGDVTKKETAYRLAKDFRPEEKMARGFFAVGRIISFVSTLIVGFLLFHFSPKYGPAAVATLRKKPWASLGVGFITLTLTPIVVIILAITLIGMPLALILLATYLVYLYLAKIFIALWVGIVLYERMDKKIQLGWTFALGLVIYSLIAQIPVVGGFTRLFAQLFGLGAMLITCKEVYLTARKKQVI